jgi:hypothetical protein
LLSSPTVFAMVANTGSLVWPPWDLEASTRTNVARSIRLASATVLRWNNAHSSRAGRLDLSSFHQATSTFRKRGGFHETQSIYPFDSGYARSDRKRLFVEQLVFFRQRR